MEGWGARPTQVTFPWLGQVCFPSRILACFDLEEQV